MTTAEEIAQKLLDQFGYIVVRSGVRMPEGLPTGYIMDHIANDNGSRIMEASLAIVGRSSRVEAARQLAFLGSAALIPTLPHEDATIYYRVVSE